MPDSRQQRSRIIRRGTLLIGCAGVLALVAFLTLNRGPAPQKEGQTWSQDELMQYLNSKGMDLAGHPSSGGAGPVMIWTDTATAANEGETFDPIALLMKGKQVQFVYVEKLPSEDQAHTLAGSISDDKSNTVCFSWGRFAFLGSAELANRIKAMLKVK
jgi:hypothetical protein